MSSKPIQLDDPNQEVILFGKRFTASELKEAIIDQRFLSELQNKLGGK